MASSRKPASLKRCRFRLEALESRELLSTLTVFSAVDGAAGSLRSVIGQAQAGDVVQFAPKLKGATLTLTAGEIAITQPLTIAGSGQTIDGSHQSRIFNINGASVSIAGLTLADGLATLDEGRGYVGGAIEAVGSQLTLTSVTLRNNVAQGGGDSPDGQAVWSAGGGAIYATGGALTLNNCTALANSVLGGDNTIDQQAGQAVGGVILVDQNPVTINGGQFNGNLAQGGSGVNPITAFPSSFGAWGAGGVVFSNLSAVTITGASISNNRAVGGKGMDGAVSTVEPGGGGQGAGGVIGVFGSGVDDAPVPITLVMSTFQNNTAQGGVAGAPMDNSQPGAQGGEAGGGVLLATFNTGITVTNCTLASNSAIGGGAGPNPAGLGNQVGWGGVATGGAISASGCQYVNLGGSMFRNNLSQGGKGSDSPSDGSSNAGAGGWAYGGAVYVLNTRGGLKAEPGLGPLPPSLVPPGVGALDEEFYVMPFTISNTTFQGNIVRGGAVGSGVQDPIHAGGGAQGGGADLSGLFNLTITRSNWVGNQAVGGAQTLSAGGGLAIVYGGTESSTSIVGGVFRNNVTLGGNDPSNSGYRDADGGAIMLNAPNAVITGTTFLANAAIGGNDTGSGNAGTGEGGAIYNVGQAPTLELDACTFNSNIALGGLSHGTSQGGVLNGDAYGGAIYSNNGTLTIRGGRFTQNAVFGTPTGPNREAQGGAIYVSPIDAPPGYDYVNNTYLTAVNFTSNEAIAYGGGMAGGGAIANYGNILTDQGSRFINNLVESMGGQAYGGGLLHDNVSSDYDVPYVPAATLRATVFSGNMAIGVNVPKGPATAFGGGIAFVNDPQALLLGVVAKKNKATTAGNNLWGKYHATVA